MGGGAGAGGRGGAGGAGRGAGGGAELPISHTFQCKLYISIACTGNFIMYALGPFSWKRSQICVTTHYTSFKLLCNDPKIYTKKTLSPSGLPSKSGSKNIFFRTEPIAINTVLGGIKVLGNK